MLFSLPGRGSDVWRPGPITFVPRHPWALKPTQPPASPCHLSDRLLCLHPCQVWQRAACGHKAPSSHSIITLNNVLCKSVTFNASKNGETINRAAGKIISMTVFCLKVKQVSYKERREEDLGKPGVGLDSSEMWSAQMPSPACPRNQRGYAGIQVSQPRGKCSWRIWLPNRNSSCSSGVSTTVSPWRVQRSAFLSASLMTGQSICPPLPLRPQWPKGIKPNKYSHPASNLS